MKMINIVNQLRQMHGKPVDQSVADDLLNKIKREPIQSPFERAILEKIKKLKNLTEQHGVVRPKFSPDFLSLLEQYNPCPEGLNAFDHDPELTYPEGLNRPINEIAYKKITNKIIEQIRKSKGTWVKEWTAGPGYMIAYSFGRKAPYRGLFNQLLLLGGPFNIKPLKNPFFLTKKEIEKAGGKLKKGAKRHIIFFYNILYRYNNDEKGLHFKTYSYDKMLDWVKDHINQINPEYKGKEERFIRNFCAVPYMKQYFVYNGSDVTGIDFDFSNVIGYVENKKLEPKKKIPRAERIIKSYPKPQPKIIHKKGNSAYYDRKEDKIVMPLRSQFNSAQAHYGTLFHELIHSTGHEKRLNREFGKRFGDHKYAYEELVAEMGAGYLSAIAGFLHRNIKNTGAYLKGWQDRLIKVLRSNDRFIIQASADARRAVDFILQDFDLKPDKKTNKAPKSTPTKPKATKSKKPESKPVKKTDAVKKNTSKKIMTKTKKNEKKRPLTQKQAAVILGQLYKTRTLIDVVKVGPSGITATDGSHYIVYKPEGVQWPEKDIFILARPFLQRMKLKTPITKITDDGTVYNGTNGIHIQSNKNYPEYRELMVKGNKGLLAQMDAKRLNYLLSKITLNDEYRRMMTGVYFDGKGGNMVATDAHIMIWDKPYKINKDADFILPKFKFPANRDLNITTVTPLDKNDYQYVRAIPSPDMEIFLRLIDAKFPLYNAVIPKEFQHKISLNREALLYVIDELKTIWKLDSNKILIFDLSGKKLKIIAKNEQNDLFAERIIDVQNHTGTKMKWGFNAMDVIKVAGYRNNETLTLQFNTEKRAFIFDDYGLVMPLQIGMNNPGAGLGFLPEKKKIKDPALVHKKTGNHKKPTPPGVIPIDHIGRRKFRTYRLGNDPLGKFLGKIEIKDTGSIVATLDAPQGAGKTRMLFQIADLFGRHGYRVLFYSLEEHPDSRLFAEKVKQYISRKARKNIDVTGEISNKQLQESVPDYDVILIDSWNKVVKEIKDKENRKLDFDYDLRKKFDGKLFVTVFQRTVTGTMRGGSQAQFDGDIIIKIEKLPDWRHNYAYYDKNRYMIDDYVWNIHLQSLFTKDEYLNLLNEYE